TGSDGTYWSSTVNSSELARRLYFAATLVDPEGNYYRYRGFSLRCVAQQCGRKAADFTFFGMEARFHRKAYATRPCQNTHPLARMI
ncbi:hypothetical protein IKG60_01715, partial [Candidatus Saccharibacteria bacterium]|nr:hypothetical protein [Candidatus Saccharibacteria bacterium]